MECDGILGWKMAFAAELVLRLAVPDTVFPKVVGERRPGLGGQVQT